MVIIWLINVSQSSNGFPLTISSYYNFIQFQTPGVGIKDAKELKLVDLYLNRYWGLKFATQAACTILTVDQVGCLSELG